MLAVCLFTFHKKFNLFYKTVRTVLYKSFQESCLPLFPSKKNACGIMPQASQATLADEQPERGQSTNRPFRR